jgi:hypothetical protein
MPDPERTFRSRQEQEETMNPKIMTAALAFATVMMTMAPDSANAAPYWPWCSRYDYARGGGALSCAFSSFEQCMDTVRGIGGYCYTNPYGIPYTPAPGRPAKSRRHAAN